MRSLAKSSKSQHVSKRYTLEKIISVQNYSLKNNVLLLSKLDTKPNLVLTKKNYFKMLFIIKAL